MELLKVFVISGKKVGGFKSDVDGKNLAGADADIDDDGDNVNDDKYNGMVNNIKAASTVLNHSIVHCFTLLAS